MTINSSGSILGSPSPQSEPVKSQVSQTVANGHQISLGTNQSAEEIMNVTHQQMEQLKESFVQSESDLSNHTSTNLTPIANLNDKTTSELIEKWDLVNPHIGQPIETDDDSLHEMENSIQDLLDSLQNSVNTTSPQSQVESENSPFKEVEKDLQELQNFFKPQLKSVDNESPEVQLENLSFDDLLEKEINTLQKEVESRPLKPAINKEPDGLDELLKDLEEVSQDRSKYRRLAKNADSVANPTVSTPQSAPIKASIPIKTKKSFSDYLSNLRNRLSNFFSSLKIIKFLREHLIFPTFSKKQSEETVKEAETLLRALSNKKPEVLSPEEFGQLLKQVEGQMAKIESGINNESSDSQLLKYIIQTPEINKHFKAFLKRIVSAENLHFYEEVEKFKKLDNDNARQQEIGNFYDRFLKQSSEEEINLSASIKNKIDEAMQQNLIPADLFDEAQKSIFALMTMDSLPKFLNYLKGKTL